MEKFAIILICLIPIVAFLLLLPAMLKNRTKKEKKAQKSPPEVKSETAPEMSAEKEKTQEAKKENFSTPSFTKDDFKGYLKEKKKKVTVPEKKKEQNGNMFETFAKYSQRMKEEKQNSEKQDKSILESMGDISPEVATIIFTNILDKKF